MVLSLFCAFLVIHTFTIATENPVTQIPYRFPVYPVNKCPTNENEFQTAAHRRNCTSGLRYLCAPNKYLSSLIEFCTDRKRSLYAKGNCLLLDGTGDLNHYSCLEKFKRSCPSKPYYDEEIYKYPVCLEIDEELRCFVADIDCMKRHFPTTETYLNISNIENVGNGTIRGASHEWLAIVFITIALLLAGMILSWIIFQKRKKEQEKKSEGNDENESLVKDPEPPIENDDSQLDQVPVNVSIQNLMQTTLATELISETNNRYTKTLPRDNQNPEESRQNTTLIDGIQQDDLQIDDDKLREFLSKGELTVCHVRCIIVGCGKAGKTTLLKRLQNLSYDEVKQTESTEMVDFHVNSFEVLLEEETIQSVKKEDTSSTILFSKEKLEKMHANAGQWTDGIKNIENEYDDHAENLGARGENGPTFFEKPALEETRHSQRENLSIDTLRNPAETHSAENKETPTLEPNIQDETLSKIQSSFETYQKQDEEIEKNADNDDIEEYAISKIKDAVNELLNEHDLRPRITFLDFAGQSMYYAFHQIFLRPKSCSILVVDMTKRLDDTVDVKNKDEKDCSLFASWKYRDYYKFWLTSIDSFSDITTPVIVVGTHADKLSEEKCGEFFDEFFKLFDDWPHFDLRRHLNTDRRYTIGFPEPGSVELKDLKDIKKCIADIMTAPDYLEENIRPVWALYEHILIKMKKTKKIISRKTLSDCSDQLSAPGLRLSDDEISKMLIFLHRVGILLYFEEDDLREKIILDIQWLLDAFKCIINYRVKADVNDMKRTHFYRTGELDDAELDRIWKIEKKEYLEHKTTIIAYMQQLGLLMTFPTLRCVPSTVHYIPCMNSKKFDKTGENNSKSSILCFKFEETKQLPTNVFYGIVSKCLENWSILTEKTKDNTCLYHNAACFSFENHVVVLCICKFQILVQVWALPEIYDAKLLKKIKRSIEKLIQEYKMVSYEVGYKCQKDVLNAEKDLSFIPEFIFPVSNFLCETCDVEKKHPVGNDTCWELTENQKNDIVVALDFGTTNSGFAFSRTQTPSNIIIGKWNSRSQNILESVRTPTSLLLNKENKVIEFGYEAERIFQQLVENGREKECRFFRQFKMILHNRKSINMDTMIEDHLKNPIKALEVFSLSIQCLKKKCIDFFQKNHVSVAYDDIQWILSVPAIWGESAKQFMRMAAEQADIPSDQLKLALESEAAAIYIIKSASMEFGRKYLSTVEPGTKIMVADLGGGTADMTVLELDENKTLKQVHQSFGGAWGGNVINEKIWEIMINIFGNETIDEFKKVTEEFMKMETTIELRKRDITRGRRLMLPIFPSLAEICKTVKGESYESLITNSKKYDSIKVRTGILILEPCLVEEIYDLTLTNLYSAVDKVLRNKNTAGIRDIILVGGFAQTDIILKAFEEKFSQYKVIIPFDPALAVLKGAVMFGQDISIISSRITAHTYGFDTMRFFLDGYHPRSKRRKIGDAPFCCDIFEKMTAIGDSGDVGKTVEKEFFASSKESKFLRLYRSDTRNPKFVTDPGCEYIGTMTLDFPDLSGGAEGSVVLSFRFYDTEITVHGVDKTTGKKQKATLNLL